MNEPNEPDSLEIEADPEYPEFGARVKLVREIHALGYDAKTAAHFARLIGDKPERDAGGRIIVKEHGRELARLTLKFFES
jgi:hypothetical protein